MDLSLFDLARLERVFHSGLISGPPSAHEAFQQYLDPFSDVGRNVFENEKPVSCKSFAHSDYPLSFRIRNGTEA